ncbi:MAG: GNAT family N-acetyltransferase [Bacteroidales bacterium]|nr:GNAT family N-acetyltransferase [Bacteroidales bacterium]
MEIRRYARTDLEAIIQLFRETVHTVNAKDYTNEQLNAWAPATIDKDEWDTAFSKHLTYVAILNRMIIGFGDMDETGYLDKLFVHKNFQRTGVATAICNRLENETKADIIKVHASITAKPFFEKRGYACIKHQEVERKGIRLTNYIMTKKNRPTNPNSPS